jgi:hypothetical protein
MKRRMSAFGTKRTSVCAAVMSAFGGKADIQRGRLLRWDIRRNIEILTHGHFHGAQFPAQYSSANMIVITRWVIVGSAGSSEW